MRRSAVFERVEQEAEAAMRLFRRESQRAEYLRLHVTAMNTNRPRAQLDTVQDQVIRLGAAARRIRGELLQVVVVNRSERMVRRVPALVLFVPLEHREVHDPQEFESLRVEQLVPIVVLLRGEQPQLSASLVHRLLRTMPLRLARPGRHQQQVFVGRTGALAHFGGRFGKVALEPLGVVENAQAALDAECF